MSDQSLKVGATMNEYLNKEIKYQAKCVPNAFRQYQQLVIETSQLLDSNQSHLESEKESLFKKGFNQKKWQVGDDFDQSKTNDRDYCDKNMLPELTKRVKELADEDQYFTEQFFKEVRRIVADNIQM